MSRVRIVVLVLAFVLTLGPLVSGTVPRDAGWSAPGERDTTDVAVAASADDISEPAGSDQRAARRQGQNDAKAKTRGEKSKQHRDVSAGGKKPGRALAGKGEECAEAGLVEVPGTGLCTHGDDPTPPGYDVRREVRALSPDKARRATAELACIDDGKSGNRVQPLYVYAEGMGNRYRQYSGSFQAWLAAADQIMMASAADAGGSRRFRWVMTGGCQVDVQQVALPAAAVGSFPQMVQALQQQGFNRRDRIYMTFVDSTSSGICGLGTLSGDNRSGQENYNNVGPSYSRVDAGCWGEFVVAHELMHNLGGVNNAAPNSSGYGHCIDEYDVMCYQDGTSMQIQVRCADLGHEYRYDCGKDDYFHPNPAPGTYLAQYWNTANSSFLVADNQLFRPDTVALTSPRSGERLKEMKSVTVSARADARAGVFSVEFRYCAGRSCTWDNATPLGNDFTAPFTLKRKLPKKGAVTLLAAMTDTAGTKTISNPVTVKVKKQKNR